MQDGLSDQYFDGSDGRHQELHKKIAQLMERIVEASSLTAIEAYEKRIGKLEADMFILTEQIAEMAKPKKPFEETFRTAFDFLSSPVKFWQSGEFGTQKTVLKLTFAKQLSTQKETGLEPLCQAYLLR